MRPPLRHPHSFRRRVRNLFGRQISEIRRSPGREGNCTGREKAGPQDFVPPQQVNSMPSLPTYNRFDVLAIHKSNETIETVETAVQNLQSLPTAIPHFPQYPAPRPKWERPLPSKFVIAAMDGNSTSLKLKVELETTDTAEVKSVNVLVDCGATGEFIDRHYAKSCGFHLLKLSKPIPVYNVDGTPNEAGFVTEVVDLILRYKNHSERTLFAVSSLGKQKLILGHSWLRKHNPEINWTTGEVKMSRCPPQCCAGCRDEAHQEGMYFQQSSNS